MVLGSIRAIPPWSSTFFISTSQHSALDMKKINNLTKNVTANLCSVFADSESLDRENLPETRMYPDYSQQRCSQVLPKTFSPFLDQGWVVVHRLMKSKIFSILFSSSAASETQTDQLISILSSHFVCYWVLKDWFSSKKWKIMQGDKTNSTLFQHKSSHLRQFYETGHNKAAFLQCSHHK